MEARTAPGSFYNGRMYWLTEVSYKNGDRYRGCFKDGRPNGVGTMKYSYSLPNSAPNGTDYEEAEYKGSFKAGRRDGFGVMTWSDGSSYRGLWKNDSRLSGEMVMASGYQYKGGFVADKMHDADGLLLLAASGVIFQG